MQATSFSASRLSGSLVLWDNLISSLHTQHDLSDIVHLSHIVHLYTWHTLVSSLRTQQDLSDIIYLSTCLLGIP